MFSVTSRFIVSRTSVACVSNNLFSFVSTFSSKFISSYRFNGVLDRALALVAGVLVAVSPFPRSPSVVNRPFVASGAGTGRDPIARGRFAAPSTTRFVTVRTGISSTV
jgi:hypothetical protein